MKKYHSVIAEKNLVTFTKHYFNEMLQNKNRIFIHLLITNCGEGECFILHYYFDYISTCDVTNLNL